MRPVDRQSAGRFGQGYLKPVSSPSTSLVGLFLVSERISISNISFIPNWFNKQLLFKNKKIGFCITRKENAKSGRCNPQPFQFCFFLSKPLFFVLAFLIFGPYLFNFFNDSQKLSFFLSQSLWADSIPSYWFFFDFLFLIRLF